MVPIASARRARVTHIALAVLFAIVALLVAPFSRSERRVLVPPDRELDAIEEALLIDRGATALKTHPSAYYDTDVLYPDRNQIRGTEPLLGFAVVGWPLKDILGLDEARVFETLRWLVVWASLAYACLWLRLLGVGLELASAGAILCVLHPAFLTGIERLQILDMPLLLAALYHGVRVARGDGAWHAAALFAWTALYPLVGMINALMALVAVVFVLPAIARSTMATADGRRRRQIAAILLLAAVTDTALTAPWLFDRSDMSVYASSAFLDIKHWQAQSLPSHLGDVLSFVTRSLGVGLLMAIAALVYFVIDRRLRQSAFGRTSAPVSLVAVGLTMCLATMACLLMVASASTMSWWQSAFQVLAPATLFWFYVRQYQAAGSRGPGALFVARFGAGLGLLLCVVSLGPVYASNTAAPTTYLANGLLHLLPPLKSLREFSRFWAFGMFCLSISAALWIGLVMQTRSRGLRLLMATAMFAAALTALVQRPLVASDRIEAPKDFLAVASRSAGRGAIYVHPYMKWNTLSGLWMIPASKALGRPIVNGYLGIEPPWFVFASRVLNRFPDAEASWLLRAWRVETVVSLVGELRDVDETVARETARDGSGVIYEMNSNPGTPVHPSAGTCGDLAGGRLDVASPKIDALNDTLTHTIVAVPDVFQPEGVEVRFAPSVTALVPPSIDAYEIRNGARVRMNEGGSGTWLESLAADALLHRRGPTALLRFERRVSTSLELVFHGAAVPPLDGLTLCGSWIQAGPGNAGH